MRITRFVRLARLTRLARGGGFARSLLLLIAVCLACASTARAQATSSSPSAPASASAFASAAPVEVLVKTELGDILLAVDVAKAPATAANFLRYVDAKLYDAGTFHRTVKMDNQPDSPVKIEVIQAGVNPSLAKQGFDPIKIERTSVTGLKHVDGAISMARAAPDSATSGWFICINDQPELDFGGKRNPDGQGFAAFGRVLKGMDVVKKIQQAPNTEAQKLTPPIKILSVARVKAS